MIPYDISIKYMLAGYSIIFFILTVYLISLITKWRKLKRDLRILQEIEK
jgi:CcmD family protein